MICTLHDRIRPAADSGCRSPTQTSAMLTALVAAPSPTTPSAMVDVAPRKPWSGPSSASAPERRAHYAYEHPWMIGSPERTAYPREFYAALSVARRKLFHGFLFRP